MNTPDARGSCRAPNGTVARGALCSPPERLRRPACARRHGRASFCGIGCGATRRSTHPLADGVHDGARAARREIVEIPLPGSMQAMLKTGIYARTDGYLKARYVDIGDHVTAGQLLAEIETPEVEPAAQPGAWRRSRRARPT